MRDLQDDSQLAILSGASVRTSATEGNRAGLGSTESVGTASAPDGSDATLKQVPGGGSNPTRLVESNMDSTVTYFIQGENGGPIKIGRAHIGTTTVDGGIVVHVEQSGVVR